MIYIIITSYKEPKSTLRAINAFLQQDIKQDFRIIVSDPFPEVKDFLKQHLKDKRVGFFLDPGEGKSYALNLLLGRIYSANKDDILIFTDGDVYLSPEAINSMLDEFEEEKVGCVTGRPVPQEDKSTKYGYWSHFLFDAAHTLRLKLKRENKTLKSRFSI